jgi:uncharacterized coiled-coil DUF342 family protein
MLCRALERVDLETRINKYRMMTRRMALDPETEQRINNLIEDLEKQLRAIDE